MTTELLDLLEDPGTTIAVIGATDTAGKYGGRIYRDLKRKGYTVVAVNPGRESVDGDPCYPDLESLPALPDIVNIVVPPPVTLKTLQECVDLDIERVWIQPGAADGAVRAFVEEHGLTALIDACIMLEAHGV